MKEKKEKIVYQTPAEKRKNILFKHSGDRAIAVYFYSQYIGLL